MLNKARVGGLEKRQCGSVHGVQRRKVPDLSNARNEERSDRELCCEPDDICGQHDRSTREAVCDHTTDQQEHQQGN